MNTITKLQEIVGRLEGMLSVLKEMAVSLEILAEQARGSLERAKEREHEADRRHHPTVPASSR